MSTYDLVAQTSPGELGVVQAKIHEPAEDQVVIKVEYSVLGPFDLYNLDRQFYVDKYPYVFGLSASGTVQKIGAGVTDLRPGDRVCRFAALAIHVLSDANVFPLGDCFHSPAIWQQGHAAIYCPTDD